jgi:hypothetical protein
MHTQERRALDRWARKIGWSDFDTYVATGGSVSAAMSEIRHAIDELGMALSALRGYAVRDEPTSQGLGDYARHLEELEREHSGDEPVDTGNAHVQGDDHAEG